ncbi:subtilisin-like serine-protease S [Aristolochia californica]|uniref:subtilisin-like serine-protease S n=1 Tax=Aristolochia californica TaxID=171875 RepID=UPI0035D87E8A
MKLVLVFSLLFMSYALVLGTTPTKHYIVYMGEHSHPSADAVVLDNHAMLASITGSMHKAQQATVHHYSKSFRGFSAMLIPEQARLLAEREGVISVFESKTSRIHTTHSWDFLGLSAESQLPLTDYFQSDVIVGSIDTGVWPESASFNDEGMGPVPKRFKGECVTGANFTWVNCNRKIIGARYYYKGFEAENGPLELFGGVFFRSPRDADGHGTHTASTVAGSIVPSTSLLGIATGTARGGATRARLAIYKACWFGLCSDADLFSAFDDAISDGVDIISISAGPSPPQPSFFSEPISIGSFHAFEKGILTSASAGNAGFSGTACNVAPWILTVAASSVDRQFHSNLTLGNSKVLKGQSVNPLKMDGFFGIIPASVAAAPGASSLNASFCKNNTLDLSLVKGKIVICIIEEIFDARGAKAEVVRELGGVGMILVDPIATDVGFQFVIPTTIIGLEEAKQLFAYLSQNNPVANIARTVTVLHTKPAPEMAVFSSMGPNVITPELIKPDITAPGLNILAAWSPVALDSAGKRSVDYNIISGTSMSCPHVSAAAAILKSYRPHWSPAAIKSALMTTATVLDNTGSTLLRHPNGSPTTPFDYGSGHLRPLAALKPGLIYDHDTDDIINFLCSSGATPAQFRNLTGNPTTCRKTRVPTYNLNYPSIGVSNMTGRVSVLRTVTYYGEGRSVFVASVDYPAGVKITVVPSVLEFKWIGQKKSYRVDFVPNRDSNGSFVFGALTWSDGRYFVRSPIALHIVSV